MGSNSFTSEDDSLVLEDESGRVSISGPGIQCQSMVSGARFMFPSLRWHARKEHKQTATCSSRWGCRRCLVWWWSNSLYSKLAGLTKKPMATPRAVLVVVLWTHLTLPRLRDGDRREGIGEGVRRDARRRLVPGGAAAPRPRPLEQGESRK